MRSIGRMAPAALGIALLLVGCQPDSRSAAPSSQQVADAFVANVVVPNYRQLAERSQQLASALDALAAKPGATELNAARTAWQQVRATWETSESWAFGPAESGGFDGNLDDWPVNEKDLGTALASGTMTPELFTKLTTTAKGFHGIEAVLYGMSGTQPEASQLTTTQLAYLRAAGADLVTNARGLLAAWDGPKGFGSDFNANGDEAVAEIIQGMVGTLEEVAAEKLGAPLKSGNSAELESYYSDNTRSDIIANLAGVQQVLMQSGLIDLIQSRDAKLARALNQELDQAQASAKALPSHLNHKLSDKPAREQMQAVITQSERSAELLKQVAALLS